jgi:uncharacterized membrane protein
MIFNFLRDPVANTQAVIVLVALVICLIASLVLTLRDRPVSTGKNGYTILLLIFSVLTLMPLFNLLQTQGLTLVLTLVTTLTVLANMVAAVLTLNGNLSGGLIKSWHTWDIPALVIGGLVVAGYLTFVEAANSHPVCGPVGDCGAVQTSRYATLFGFLSVGMLGVIGYSGILVAWIVRQLGPQSLKKLSSIAIWGMCLFGVIFSTYLTFLEPFVIGATCMWCLTSAALMIMLLWISTPAAQQALAIEYEDDE